MNDFQTTSAVRAREIPAIPGGVVIIASEAEITNLKRADGEGSFASAHMEAIAPGEQIPQELLASARLLVVEVDPAIPVSLQRIRTIRSEFNALPIIAALRGMDVAAVRTLVRQGVTDVTELPISPADLLAQIADAGARLAPAAMNASLAPLMTVVGGTGGSGTTTIITHLAALLAKSGELRVCVVDLDLQGGEVAYYVGVTPKVTIATLIDAADRLDAQFVKGVLTQSEHGFSLIAAPEKVTPLDEVNVDELLNLLTIIRQQFDLVLVDLPSDWTNWSLSVAMASTQIVLVTDLSVACLRQTRRRLELFDSVGIAIDQVRLVANRVEQKYFKTINLTDAAKALKHEFVGSLADEGPTIGDAQDEGHLIWDFHRRSKFASDLEHLADKLLAENK